MSENDMRVNGIDHELPADKVVDAIDRGLDEIKAGSTDVFENDEIAVFGDGDSDDYGIIVDKRAGVSSNYVWLEDNVLADAREVVDGDSFVDYVADIVGLSRMNSYQTPGQFNEEHGVSVDSNYIDAIVSHGGHFTDDEIKTLVDEDGVRIDALTSTDDGRTFFKLIDRR